MADLKIKIKGDNSSLNRALTSSKSKLQSFAGGFKRFMASGAGLALTAAAGGIAAIGAAAVSAVRYLDNMADALDDIGKGSRRIGITTDEFQYIAFAARRTGSSTADVERAFKRMQKTIWDAGKGLSTAKDALNALGIEFKDIDGLSPEKQFQMIASKIALIDDATRRAGISQEIFGRVGTKITPLISEYEKLKKRLDEIKGVIGAEAIKDAEEYKDAVEDLSTAFKALSANSGGIELLANSLKLVESAMSEIRNGGVEKKPIGEAVTELLTNNLLGIGIPSLINNLAKDEQLRRTGNKMIGTMMESLSGAVIDGLSGTSEKEDVNKAVEGFLKEKQEKRQSTGLLSGTPIGGGGTLASLGGDISGGGFAARINIQERQLVELKEIKEIAKQLVDVNGGSVEDWSRYVDSVRDIFQD